MKKILSLLGSLGLIVSGAVTVVSCNTEQNQNKDNKEFNKILQMNRKERNELETISNNWFNEFEDGEQWLDIRALFDSFTETYPEGVTDKYFNDEFLHYLLSLLTLEILNVIEEENIIFVLQNQPFPPILTLEIISINKFANTKNKLWAKNIIGYFDNWLKSIWI